LIITHWSDDRSGGGVVCGVRVHLGSPMSFGCSACDTCTPPTNPPHRTRIVRTTRVMLLGKLGPITCEYWSKNCLHDSQRLTPGDHFVRTNKDIIESFSLVPPPSGLGIQIKGRRKEGVRPGDRGCPSSLDSARLPRASGGGAEQSEAEGVLLLLSMQRKHRAEDPLRHASRATSPAGAGEAMGNQIKGPMKE